MVLKSPNAFVTLVVSKSAVAMAKGVNGVWKIMTDQNRFENIENVRDLYREQGAVKERERILEILEYWDVNPIILQEITDEETNVLSD